MAEVDLHLHTTISDGRLTPEQLVHLVARRGLRVVAVSDHDITDGLEAAWNAAEEYPQLTILPGVELSTDIPGNEIHVLGYCINYRAADFQAALKRFRDSRVGRAQGMVERLRALGMPVDWERVQQIAGEGAIGRPHIARAMLERGYISRLSEAFDNYIGRNGVAYVEREKQSPEEAIQLIIKAGGVPVLAHPAHLNNISETIDELKAAGLEGMEVFYAEYSHTMIEHLKGIALQNDLLPCGGSDYHANDTPREPIPGDNGPPLWVADRVMEIALERGGVLR